MSAHDQKSRTIEITERREIPLLSVVLGYGPMLPFLAGGLAVWLVPAHLRSLVEQATVIWAGAILTFLAGVRRGVSFRTAGGPTVVQIATMFIVFCLGLAALGAQALGFMLAAEILLVAGFAGLAVLDPIAAEDGEAPLFFARLRPTQLPLAAIGLLGLVAHRLFA